jgi:CBS-domain-containing membrane protein
MHTMTKPFLALTAQDLMSRELVVLPQELSLKTAARWLARDHISGAPVVDEAGCCIGVLSSTDFVRYLEKEEGAETPHCTLTADVVHGWQMIELEMLPQDQVRNFMTPSPLTVAPNTSIVELARLMLEAHVHRLIVVDEDLHPIGIVTATDILAAVAHTNRQALEKVHTSYWPCLEARDIIRDL